MKSVKKIAMVIALLTVLISPNIVSAETFEELQSKITGLLK